MEERNIEIRNDATKVQRYRKKRYVFKKKYCYFCAHRDVKIDYKNVDMMKRFVSESYKITPRRFTGTCAKHQRRLVSEIKKARIMALMPFVEE